MLGQICSRMCIMNATAWSRLFSTGKAQEPSFAKLFYDSALVRMGDPNGAIVKGKIVHVMEKDLYIDFGGKFNCVCKRPFRNGQAYRRGTEVRLRLHDLELSARFLGSEKDITIAEADATLLGFVRSDRARAYLPSQRRTSRMDTMENSEEMEAEEFNLMKEEKDFW